MHSISPTWESDRWATSFGTGSAGFLSAAAKRVPPVRRDRRVWDRAAGCTTGPVRVPQTVAGLGWPEPKRFVTPTTGTEPGLHGPIPVRQRSELARDRTPPIPHHAIRQVPAPG